MAAPSTNLEARPRSTRRSAPIALYAGFGVFLLAIAYLVASSVGRRTVLAYTVSPEKRVRSPAWERTGDTITIDASDDGRWRYVSLASGKVLAAGDTSGWTIGVERYRVMVNGTAADAGSTPFAAARAPAASAFVGPESLGDSTNAALRHWYRYNFLTHLLEPKGNVYVLRDRDDRLWKLQVVSYYCPKAEAGCLTISYAPVR